MAMEHTWLSGPNSAKIKYPVHPHVMFNLSGGQTAHELHFELLMLFTQFLEDKDIRDIRETF